MNEQRVNAAPVIDSSVSEIEVSCEYLDEVSNFRSLVNMSIRGRLGLKRAWLYSCSSWERNCAFIAYTDWLYYRYSTASIAGAARSQQAAAGSVDSWEPLDHTGGTKRSRGP